MRLMFGWWAKAAFTAAFATMLFGACGGDSGVNNGSDALAADGGMEVAGVDLPKIEVVFPDVRVDYGALEDCCDGNEIDTGGSSLDAPDDGDLGGGLQTCENGDACQTGFCIELDDGSKVCAPPCLEQECPPGWECKAVNGVGDDVIFICLPSVERLCRPCEYNEDCAPDGVPTDDLCVDWGPDGKFCGRDCSQGGTCPDGYSCFDVPDPMDRASVYPQCLPTEGQCPCTPSYIANGFKTSCYVANDQGTCQGERFCGPDGLTDCDARVPQAEQCNGQDDNCDGTTDEGITAGECEKTFGEFVCVGPEVCEGGELVCKAQEPGPEICDGKDNDCDGETDPEGADGCWQLFRDEDGDTYGTSDVRCLCGPEGAWSAQVGGDCDDGDVWVNPSVTEACNGKDDDCDGLTDEEGTLGCKDHFLDVDGDGYGTPTEHKCLCGEESGWVVQAGDCEDGNPEVNPGAKEVCDGVDNDCDGAIDPEGSAGCETYYFDGDGDGFGIDGDAVCVCAAVGNYTTKTGGDCQDADADVNPGAPETCDGKDNDCNAMTDEEGALGCEVYYADQDSDSWGATMDSKCLCATAFPYLVTQPGDCDDADPFAFPDGEEKCNGKDDDCDGTTDEIGAVGCQGYFFDNDSDGWGIAANVKCLCGPDGLYTGTQTEDCNDYDASVHPGAPEACDGKDNDCNQHIDEGEGGAACKTYYFDGDSDGWGISSSSKCLCKITGQYSTLDAGDCNDGNGAVHPGAIEVCNSLDDDCNSQVDDGEGVAGCSVYYFDGDSDNWGVGSDSKCFCKPTGNYKAFNPGDCDDDHAVAHPGGSEVCDLLDNDCNGVMDDPFVAESYNSYYQSGDPAGAVVEDFTNAWYGPMISTCIWNGVDKFCTGISGVQSGRLLPGGDQDWMSVYKEDSWGAVFGGRVVFTGAPDRSYEVCVCYSTYDTQCGASSPACKVSSNGAQVTVETSTGAEVTQGWLDISVKPVGAMDFACGQYNVTWTVW
ncbi:MAG: hypothetical protein GXP54_11870 [Deltaproteobacteria bacterium]|nr:hypothetical protein [Deltaproteobacteria bacterium]